MAKDKDELTDLQLDMIFHVSQQIMKNFDQMITDQLDPRKNLPWYERAMLESLDMIRQLPRTWRLKKVAWHRTKKLVRLKMERGENPSRAMIKHYLVGLVFINKDEMPSSRIKHANYLWFMS
jgi:hypothetical protein